jgi:hypothetical protein
MKKNVITLYSVSRAITLNQTWPYIATHNEHCAESNAEVPSDIAFSHKVTKTHLKSGYIS